jgi:hypothetical protein
MPARLFGIVGLVLLVLSCASQASAAFCFDFFNSIARDVKRRQCWPEPFGGADRAAARMPFVTMVSNGWRRQNMLGDAHFDPSTGQLTEAGRIKLRWILINAPQQHRVVYVRVGMTDEETSNRFASVQQLVCQVAPANPPPMLPTSLADDGRPAAEVGAITRKYLESTPIPRLAVPSSGGGSSGGSGGN